MTNSIAEAGKAAAIYRLQTLAVKAERKGDSKRAATLRDRVQNLINMEE